MGVGIFTQDGRSKCSVRLELAMLYYIRNFRKTYVSEQHGMPNPQVDGGGDAVPRTTRQQVWPFTAHGSHSSPSAKCAISGVMPPQPR